MAVKKSNTSTSTAGKMTIPKSERNVVKRRRALLVAAGEKDTSAEAAYRSILRQRRFTEKRLVKEEAKKRAAEKENKSAERERAIETLSREIMHLADIRSLLRRMETGEDRYFCAEAQATFARAALSDAGAEIEQALVDLGVLKRGECGYFVPALGEKSQPLNEVNHA